MLNSFVVQKICYQTVSTHVQYIYIYALICTDVYIYIYIYINKIRSHFGSSHFEQEPARSSCLLVAGMSHSRHRTALQQACDTIDASGWAGKDRRTAIDAAFKGHFGVTADKPASGTMHPSPITDLERCYGFLTRAAGVTIKRPTVASAYLKAIGLSRMCGRLSRLSSRRRMTAHTDAAFPEDLDHALQQLDIDTLAQAGKLFIHDNAATGTSSDEGCSSAGSGISSSSKGDDVVQEMQKILQEHSERLQILEKSTAALKAHHSIEQTYEALQYVPKQRNNS